MIQRFVFVVCVCWSVIFSNMFIYSSVISVTLPFSWAWEDKWFHQRKHTIRFCGLMFDHFTDLHRFSLNLSECKTTCEFSRNNEQYSLLILWLLWGIIRLKNGRKQYFVMNSIRQIESLIVWMILLGNNWAKTFVWRGFSRWKFFFSFDEDECHIKLW